MNRTSHLHHKIFALLTLTLALLNAPVALAQGYSTYGAYPATPGSWNGSVSTVQPYVPANLPNGVPINQEISPNYIGSGHGSSYGDYRNPSVGYQTGTYTGQPLTYRPNTTINYGNYSNNQYGGRGFNPMGMIVGGGILGVGAVALGARAISRRGGSNGGGTGGNYKKDMEESDERRKKQEEKITRELAKAHEQELKRKGILPTSAQAPSQNGGQFGSAQPFQQSQPQHQPKVKMDEELQGDVLPASAAGKLDF